MIETCSYNNFATCFPTPAANQPAAVKELHENFNDRLGRAFHSEFEKILAERNVVGSLNELDRLIEDAKKRKARAQEEAGDGIVEAPIP